MAFEIEVLDVIVSAAGGAAEVARDIRCGLRTCAYASQGRRRLGKP